MLAEETPRILHAGDDSRGPFPLSVGGTPITYADSSHIQVTRYDNAGVGTLQVLGTHYTLSADYVLPDVGLEEQNVTAATLTFRDSVDVLADDEHVLIERVTPSDQTQHLVTGGGFSSANNERFYDKVLRRIQELEERVSRALLLNDLDATAALRLPTLDDLDGMVLGVADGALAAVTGGNAGWSPVLAVVADGSRRVLRVTDWTGGEGTAPDTGDYVGSSGLVTLIADAVDIRGAQGTNGNGSGDVIAANNGTEFTAATFATNLGLFRIANNLSEGNASTMRSNLGLTSTAITALSSLLLKANNLSDLPNAGTARTNLGLATMALLAEMTTAEFLANTADKGVSTDQLWAAAEPVALTDAATVVVNFSTGVNFTLTLGGNRTLGNPSNVKYQSGVIAITQDGTGSRTLSYGANWEFAGGTAPTLSTAAGAKDLLFYIVLGPTSIYAQLVKAVA